MTKQTRGFLLQNYNVRNRNNLKNLTKYLKYATICTLFYGKSPHSMLLYAIKTLGTIPESCLRPSSIQDNSGMRHRTAIPEYERQFQFPAKVPARKDRRGDHGETEKVRTRK